jgi:hypothetical protein
MRRWLSHTVFVAALVAGLFTAAAERSSTDAKVIGRANKTKISAYVMLIRLRGDLFVF